MWTLQWTPLLWKLLLWTLLQWTSIFGWLLGHTRGEVKSADIRRALTDLNASSKEDIDKISAQEKVFEKAHRKFGTTVGAADKDDGGNMRRNLSRLKVMQKTAVLITWKKLSWMRS